MKNIFEKLLYQLVIVFMSTSVFAGNWNNTFKLNSEFKKNDANVTDKAVKYNDDVMTITLGQYLGKVKLIDLRLTEAIFLKEDKSYIIIDFNNQIREADEY